LIYLPYTSAILPKLIHFYIMIFRFSMGLSTVAIFMLISVSFLPKLNELDGCVIYSGIASGKTGRSPNGKERI
ncbi:MAG: hypothetical protein DI538_27900, partial [Azospira oryzae]